MGRKTLRGFGRLFLRKDPKGAKEKQKGGMGVGPSYALCLAETLRIAKGIFFHKAQGREVIRKMIRSLLCTLAPVRLP